MKMKKLLTVGLVLLFATAPLTAGDENAAIEPASAPEPPDIPPPVQSGEALEPEIIIRRTEDKIIKEYRVEGKLVMVKITPTVGPAYYLLDTDGDGELDAREDDSRSASIQQWLLFSWD
ncbi:hypothetical protein MNBD_GAMMA26-530 [hydrothermal vent metagenome]|uniref:DUF2782 domain-containing protein n=1 Tax=hydrothermal vent metagenome TaxID=652676 RepID=A0A3B1BA64_9ZZZZ